MVSLAIFGMVGGLSTVALTTVDKILLNEYYNLSLAGVYTISFYFASIILIPNKALGKISSTIIADSWKEMDLKKIDDIYYKSSINQLFAGLLLFVLMVGNLHNIFKILPPEYGGGEWVVVLISLANLAVVSTGVSVQILSTSHRYKVQTYSTGILIGLTIISYLIFIPLWGMNGAALGTLFSMVSSSIMRVFYIQWDMKLFPFKKTHLQCLAIGLLAYLCGFVLPVIEPFPVDLFIRSLVISGIYVGLSYWLNISDDMTLIGNKVRIRIRNILK
jgi:O-antigen/teichoic acid export membrane protein